MPVSVACDSTASTASAVNTAIHESLANQQKSNTNGNNNVNGLITSNLSDDTDSIQNRLAATTKRVLFSKIDYEEVDNSFKNNLEQYKTKYVELKPLNNLTNGNILTTSAASTTILTTTVNNTNYNNGNIQNGGKLLLENQHQQNICNNATSMKYTNDKELLKVDHNNVQKIQLTELPEPQKILFPRENVQIGWRSSGRKWHIGAGMLNVGNTCYLNSTLQALFHVPAVANWLMSDTQHREKCSEENGSQDSCIICAMAKTLITSQQNQSAIRPWLVYSKLRLICKHLIMGRQEDAHEFLRYLVEAMEKSFLQRFRNFKELDQFSKETTPFNQILGGYLRSAVRCLSCCHVSTTFQHFQDILLDIRKVNSIEEALDAYFARERLEDMGYKCESCKKKVSATKQFLLERAPISLCIQLKRFSMLGTKLTKHIQIKPRLNLTKYASKNAQDEMLSYKLVAMVTHLGATQHCGHYTAIGCTEAGGYYQFDDSCVRSISLQNVLSTNAYIIFYELDNANKPSSTQVNSSFEVDKNKENGHTLTNNIPKPFSTNVNNSNILFSNSNRKHSPITVTETRIIGPQLPEANSTEIPSTNSVARLNSPNKLINFEETNEQSNKETTATTITNDSATEISDKTTTELNDIKSILPCMPKLNNDQNKLTETATSTIVSETLSNSATPIENSKLKEISPILYQNLHGETDVQNKSENLLLKKLVPYETDDSEDDLSPAINKIENNHQNGNGDLCENELNKTTNGKEESNLSPDSKSLKTSSPYCVETQVGIWKVTNLNKKELNTTDTLNLLAVKKLNLENINFNLCNGNNNESDANINNSSNIKIIFDQPTNKYKSSKETDVTEFLKQVTRGYGGPVLNWNGHETILDKETAEKNYLERKRKLEADAENEMDRGRQKKVKINYNNDTTFGYNPFQEMQRKNNHDQRRWINPSIVSSTSINNGRFHNNNYYRNGNTNNSNNSNNINSNSNTNINYNYNINNINNNNPFKSNDRVNNNNNFNNNKNIHNYNSNSNNGDKNYFYYHKNNNNNHNSNENNSNNFNNINNNNINNNNNNNNDSINSNNNNYCNENNNDDSNSNSTINTNYCNENNYNNNNHNNNNHHNNNSNSNIYKAYDNKFIIQRSIGLQRKWR